MIAPSFTSFRSSKGFSLIEVTLTLALVSFALLPILGMLGSGRGMQRESEDRFVAADLSLALLSQLQMVESELILITAPSSESEVPKVVSLGDPITSKSLSITVSCDRAGGVLESHLENTYATGLPPSDDDALHLARIEITEPTPESAGDSMSKSGGTGFRKVTISIEQPAFVAQENRSKRVFQTFKSFTVR